MLRLKLEIDQPELTSHYEKENAGAYSDDATLTRSWFWNSMRNWISNATNWDALNDVEPFNIQFTYCKK